MCARVLRFAGLLLVGVLFTGIAAADGADQGWPLPGTAPVVLGFGSSYVGENGTSSVHRGVDLAATGGTAVTGVLAGTVTFSGRVPAGEGATTIAVTVESGDLRLTYMPLSEAVVSAGDTLAAGARIGTLAPSGDRSSGESHLHLGARRGSLYIDPMAFLLQPPAAAANDMAEPVSVPVDPALVPAAPSPVAVAGGPSADPVPETSRVEPMRAPSSQGSAVGVTGAQPVPAHGVTLPSGGVLGESPPAASSVPVASGVGAPVEMRAGSASAEAASAPDVAAPAALSGPGRARASISVAGVIPDAGVSSLAVDRRAEAMREAPLPVSAIAALAAVLGAALLWPVWRSAPVPEVAVTVERQDVAAVVAR
ncbi:MAG: peptidoglycan DD-metalloendopeptidase family protein [Anaerosomatales bacterium]|nr:peptidoglycan DD-metalloendopeptidase family protein [Anaerosomatales bacterium]MDT8433763.1 peptidoglycan DD-metalloendopeptidase family protein [Anaerosomatales bacterium]